MELNIFEELEKHKKYVDDGNDYRYEKPRDKKQHDVICLDNGYNLVLAPAGCGKTDILAERVNRAIYHGKTPEDMLCLTFTNRASRGMASRVRSVIGDSAAGMFIGNTHRFCSKFLFDNHIIPQNSSIIDEDDSAALMESEEAYPPFHITYFDNGRTIERSVHASDSDIYPIVIEVQNLFRQIKLQFKQELLIPGAKDLKFGKQTWVYCAQSCWGYFETLCKLLGVEYSFYGLIDIFENYHRYESQLQVGSTWYYLLKIIGYAKTYELDKERNCMYDFADLLIETYHYAIHHQDEIHKYSWVQIDEVQDLNQLQFAIADIFTAKDQVTIYLGDEQQAIFSFMGAKLDTLTWLKERCGSNLLHLNKCYRSPKYLLDVFNDYASFILDTDPDFLPKPDNSDNNSSDYLAIHYTDTNEVAHEIAAITAKQLDQLSTESSIDYTDNDSFKVSNNNKTVVIVPSNRDADSVSEELTRLGLEHFKISGIDLFSLHQVKLLFSHLAVIYNQFNNLAWSRILHALKLFDKISDARRFVNKLKRNGLNPSDLLFYDQSSYLLDFIENFHCDNLVVFDTETTGLNVFNDDIVQIAASKYSNGVLVDSINLIIHTDREIPARLGGIENPLIEVYNSSKHLSHKDALQQFLNFSKGSIVLGQNIDYDINILIHNCKRYLDIDLNYSDFKCFDTLKLSRLISPNLRSYKLKDLLAAFDIAGENSHLANDDILATYNVAEYCYNQALGKIHTINDILASNAELSEKFKQVYLHLYKLGIDSLYIKDSSHPSILIQILEDSYSYFEGNGYIKKLEKFRYLVDFLATVINPDKSEECLYTQLGNHITELPTYKEADLCDSSIIKENIFVSTVHKAKGLEFENVIVYGVVNGTYPFFMSRDEYSIKEDARKLYVALSRAIKRLHLIAYEVYITPQGYSFSKERSPFINRILSQFNFKSIQH